MKIHSGSNRKWYSIGQVHAITGVPKPTLRFWEKEFAKYLSPIRTPGNQRRYDDGAIKLIERIDTLVHKEGYTLEGARKSWILSELRKKPQRLQCRKWMKPI